MEAIRDCVKLHLPEVSKSVKLAQSSKKLSLVDLRRHFVVKATNKR